MKGNNPIFLCFLFLLSITCVVTYELDDPTACILSNNQCEFKRSCIKVVYERECLISPIPLWSASDEKVACCFKCCVQFFLHAFKLTGDKITPNELLKAYPGKNITAPSLDSILFSGLSSSLSLSRHAVSSLGQAGNVSIMQVRLKYFYSYMLLKTTLLIKFICNNGY